MPRKLADIFRIIVGICTIGLFLFAIYPYISDKFGLPLFIAQHLLSAQYYPPLLFFLAFLFFIITLISRKSGKTSDAITLKGTQEVIWTGEYYEAKVFYSKPFEYTPNLTIHFQKWEDPAGYGWTGYEPPKYRIEQRFDGFRMEVLSLGSHKPIIEWQAKGELKKKKKTPVRATGKPPQEFEL